jgi:serine/threonine protein kinase
MSGRYALDAQPVARGAQGTVWFARRDDGRKVAIKVAAESNHAAAALLREIATLRALADAGVRGVVTVLDAIEVDGRPAMVMPRYPSHLGTWLDGVTKSPTAGALRDILYRTEQLARILARVHATPIDGGQPVHRDVKPENVFLDHVGELCLGDFGGAMAIEGLRSVELALFGTPMWAPLDQILPGTTIPDPTWDTYALCVLLYGALTGKRPAYQADPTELLTEDGRALWRAARQAIEAEPADRAAWHRRFGQLRKGTTARDLVDLTGRAALVAADRATLVEGVTRLTRLAGLPAGGRDKLIAGLWTLLARGLSPVGHPSPPNRYRDADELADELARHRAVVEAELQKARSSDLMRLEVTAVTDVGAPRSVVGTGFGTAATAVVAIVLLGSGAAAAGGAWLLRDRWMPLLAGLGSAQAVAQVAAGTVALDGKDVPVAAFRLDTVEATTAAWRACVAASACDAAVYQSGRDDTPAVGLSFADAGALCAFLGRRLPTEAEWLRAAGDGPMPWGDGAATCDRATALGCGEALTAVGATRSGATPEGVMDLAGNAWEWVATPSGGALRGGDLETGVSELGRKGRRTVAPADRPPTAGVRCAYP